MLVVLAFWLASSRLVEVLGKDVFWAGAAVLGFVPLALIVWAIGRAVRRTGSWVAVGAVVGAWIALAVAAIPLARAGVYLNFWSHRAAYDAVVADLKAGRIADRSSGSRHGVRYHTPDMRQGSVGFVWYWDFDIGQGVAYDEVDCPRQPTTPPPERSEAAAQSDGADPPVMKHAGSFYSFHLGGHYCYFTVP
ncbi:MAG: hypothetical protein ACOY5Y_09840 [Pseudomonadota bacterium]